MTQRVYIKTVGCQMNVLDSEMVIADLKRHGYTVVDSPEEADCVLYNTCSVREHAEEKVYSALGKVRQSKDSHPGKTIGVMGCMAQKDQELIFKRAPYVDLVVGPGQLHTIPDLLDKVRNGDGRQMAISLNRKDDKQAVVARSHETFDPLRDPSMRPTPFQAYLRIQIGCDKFCTYCVVPNTRGPEQGRPPSQIVSEAAILAEQGCREITLLGQTVNSYKYRDENSTTDMSSLLEMLHEVDGIDRIKFVTNYPKDMTERLLVTIRDLPKVSPYLHVPAQSGSDEVLKRMKRGYTIADYMEMFERIERILPEAAVSSDFIVGFCGETEEDFEKSVALVERCRFKNSFIFQYSVRPGTKASERFEDDIPREVKAERNHRLLDVQNRIAKEENAKLIGRDVQVLVEGPSKKASDPHAAVTQMTGRTHCDRIVVFDGNLRQAGQLLDVHVDDVSSHTLIGRVKTVDVVTIGL
ncbi:tRNA (N6-isopentenyl adenosine(37)-C2)-methylthiotransferase MiaB [Roseiconus lacunae]|uniref:tRNA-2-methylthio-N(6)-dimethylallyladenosine synthase n=1 Tax=Roseiconus lacunae TaxID=2605694 RepID=A0ABT7PMI1_9BACT|nr:tRNA (N6-isopentenyl adenosine(37)-C2)-methylthiotransferase MiaB [Roseiconus lacunae]MCD0463407.1 tRNA (N6-isopentenyl adenosine(37)-C2)-methylthiotransferase MiaB [Roseiconus lacunae]MDM4017715.1 tRNA (N6-isopentenyl adenosine(37)-C2)-methylthiotransferase MiaB [Roseiconus lacunae]WRQ48530.1 tRNA (N6-isopentenyl adenosine(37)-C2)-methylthiotransferase MiaB [Stieleria sp. HD01]